MSTLTWNPDTRFAFETVYSGTATSANWGTSYVYPPPWNANDIITIFFKIPKSASVTRNYDFCVDAIAIQF